MNILELSVKVLKQPLTVESLAEAVKPAISSKQYGQEVRLARLVAEAAMIVMPSKSANFNVDNVRVVKIMGGSFAASSVLHGMVFNREPEGTRCVSISTYGLTPFIQVSSRKSKRAKSLSTLAESTLPKPRLRAPYYCIARKRC